MTAARLRHCYLYFGVTSHVVKASIILLFIERLCLLCVFTSDNKHCRENLGKGEEERRGRKKLLTVNVQLDGVPVLPFVVLHGQVVGSGVHR